MLRIFPLIYTRSETSVHKITHNRKQPWTAAPLKALHTPWHQSFCLASIFQSVSGKPTCISSNNEIIVTQMSVSLPIICLGRRILCSVWLSKAELCEKNSEVCFKFCCQTRNITNTVYRVLFLNQTRRKDLLICIPAVVQLWQTAWGWLVSFSGTQYLSGAFTQLRQFGASVHSGWRMNWFHFFGQK